MTSEESVYHRVEAHPSARISPQAGVVGTVTLGRGVTILAGAQLRGDDAPIFVGDESNIQENSVVHVGSGEPVVIGRHVTVGHAAILHGCTIDDNVLVGMGAVIMNNAHIGAECVIGARALITEGKQFPPRTLIVGMPAKAVRSLSDEEVAQLCTASGDEYLEVGAKMLAEGVLSSPPA